MDYFNYPSQWYYTQVAALRSYSCALKNFASQHAPSIASRFLSQLGQMGA